MTDLRKHPPGRYVSHLSHNFPKCVCALYKRAHTWESLGRKEDHQCAKPAPPGARQRAFANVEKETA